MTRREARAEVLALVFEYAFRQNETADEILRKAVEIRGLEEEEYITGSFMGVIENIGFIDGKIESNSNGWKTGRMSPVALAAMRVAVYEMFFRDDVPAVAAINEALELIKIYDDDNVKGFVNGILNSVLRETEKK